MFLKNTLLADKVQQMYQYSVAVWDIYGAKIECDHALASKEVTLK